jgi:glycosyltransferase 2 family protein
LAAVSSRRDGVPVGRVSIVLRMRLFARARALAAALERNRRLKLGLELGVALVVVGLCSYAVRGEWAKAGPSLADAHPGWVGAALAAVAAYYLVFILGWLRILAALDVHVSYVAALQSEMVSMLAKYVPGGVWTPAARVGALERLSRTNAPGTVLASILIEAVLSALSGVIVFVVSLAWVRDVDAPLIPLVLFGLACAAMLHPRIFRPLMARLLRPFGVRALRPLPFPTMLALLGFYCATWLVGGLGLFFLIRSLGEDPGLATVPFLGGTAAVGAIVAVLAIVAPSGLGVREASMYGLLIAVTSKTTALGTTILNRLSITVVEVGLFACGLVVWQLRNRGAARRVRPDPGLAED